jgi:SAM-dependent methyltransferase
MERRGSLYDHRYSGQDRDCKARLWQVLITDFLQRFVQPSDTVLDLGAGDCEFINNVGCGRKIAVDTREDLTEAAADGVECLTGGTDDLSKLEPDSVNVVFASNFFEHLGSRDEMLATLHEVRRVLVPAGKLLIIQPNYRYAYKVYFDFFDHHLPLSHGSMAEALAAAGFEIEELRPRFMPFTVKTAYPKHPLLVRIYLKLRFLQTLFGKQMFVAAVKKAG